MNLHALDGNGFSSAFGLLGIALFAVFGGSCGFVFGRLANARGIPFRVLDDFRVGAACLLLQIELGGILRLLYFAAFRAQFKVGDYWPLVWVVVNAASITVTYKYARCHQPKVPDE